MKKCRCLIIWLAASKVLARAATGSSSSSWRGRKLANHQRGTSSFRSNQEMLLTKRVKKTKGTRKN
jgi:hypothetical protein